MSVQNSKFPRGLRVLITMAVLAVLIWLFAINTPYYYYSIGAAALITAVVIYLTYRKPSSPKQKVSKTVEESPAESEEEIVEAEMESEVLKPGDIAAKTPVVKAASFKTSRTSSDVEPGGESPMPLIDDPSSLTLDEKNTLVNAVWYRCENPYCKYTSFLSVHYIVEEKDGGTNKLDNLIVLCPYCHDLAHRGEIPEKEMREWLSDRAERWKFKPEWKYF
jgi:hypothetical protein